MTILVLAVLGLCFGSFINALVWRVHEQAKGKKSKALSVVNGRSMCPHCRHELSAIDLIPVISWLILHGRCRYCHRPIPDSPLVEVAVAFTFIASYLWWPMSLHGAGQWILFVTWLASSVGLIALLVYDLKWMLLPNRILYPTFFVALAGRLAYILVSGAGKVHELEVLALSILVASGVFWLLYYLSKGRWIGFGDVRLGLVTGSLLGRPALSILMIFLASVIGTIAALPSLAAGSRSFSSKLPFGPFLITATAISLLWGQSIIDWYKRIAGL